MYILLKDVWNNEKRINFANVLSYEKMDDTSIRFNFYETYAYIRFKPEEVNKVLIAIDRLLGVKAL